MPKRAGMGANQDSQEDSQISAPAQDEARVEKPRQRRVIQEPGSYINLMQFFGCTTQDLSQDVSKVSKDLKEAVQVVVYSLHSRGHANFPDKKALRGFTAQAYFFEWHSRDQRPATEAWVLAQEERNAWGGLGISWVREWALPWASLAVPNSATGHPPKRSSRRVNVAKDVAPSASTQWGTISMMPADFSSDDDADDALEEETTPDPACAASASVVGAPDVEVAVVVESTAQVGALLEGMPDPPAVAGGAPPADDGSDNLDAVNTVTALVPYEAVEATGLMDPSVPESDACARCVRGAWTAGDTMGSHSLPFPPSSGCRLGLTKRRASS